MGTKKKSSPVRSSTKKAVASRKTKGGAIPKDPPPPLLPGREPHSNKNLFVVGIGASAGGLEALRNLLPSLPVQDNVTYVIAQHLDPEHRSMLGPLLARHTEMEVGEVEDGKPLRPRRVYTTPPDRNVTMNHGVLHLNKPLRVIGPKPSVDLFFSSLGENLGERAIGIILSGTGSDGAHGVKAIKAHGGFTFAQTLETAKYDGMPRAAIETSNIDLVLPAEKIGLEISNILQHPSGFSAFSKEDETPNAFQSLLLLLNRTSGSDFSQYKPNTIHRRIARRMAVHKLAHLEDYVQLVEQSPKELELLYKDIIISVTSFFRDREAFLALKDALTKLVSSKSVGEPIRIWVPGCASGEEPLSIAILLAEIMKGRGTPLPIQIFATDIDTDALARGRKGLFPAAACADMHKSYLDRYFTRFDNSYQVVKSIREMVIYAKQDLVKDPPFSHLDFISCRNLLIYFTSALQQRLFSMFHYVLNPQGILFLGRSESVSQFGDLFAPVDKKAKIFRRRGTTRAKQKEFETRGPLLFKLEPSGKQDRPQPTLQEIVNQALAEGFTHPSVAIDERMNILHVKGDVRHFLTLASGEAGLNILSMVRSELRPELRALIYKSTREQAPQEGRAIKIDQNGLTKQCKLHVHPLTRYRHLPNSTLIVFEELQPPKRRPKGPIEESSLNEIQVMELQNELASTREHLQTTVEELETANEELQSLNEELQSSNEELQSSNEELETSNEELQSTNEELTTVNEELQERSSQLSAAHSDLENILQAIRFPMLVVDKAFRIRRFTKAARTLFELSEKDIGHVLSSVNWLVMIPNLREQVLDVISHQSPSVQDLQLRNRCYTFQISPYFSEHQEAVGAVLTFIDMTERKEAEVVRRSEERYRGLVKATTAIDWVSDAHGAFMTTQPAWETYTGQQWVDYKDWGWVDAFHPDDRETIRLGWGQAITDGAPLCRAEGRVWHAPTKEYHHCLIRSVPVFEQDGTLREWIGALTDIHDRKLMEEELRRTEEGYRNMIAEVQDYAILRLSQEGIIQTWNEGAEKIKGYKADEIIGTNFRCFYTEEDQQANKPESLLQIARTAGRVQEENWRVRKDGSRFWASITITALHNQQGEVIGFTKVTRDLSERRWQGNALRETEAHLMKALEWVRAPVITVNETDCITSFNQVAEQLFGYSATEVIGQPFEALLGQRFAKKFHEDLHKFANDPQPVLAETPNREILVRRKDGVEITTSAMVVNQSHAHQTLFTMVLSVPKEMMENR